MREMSISENYEGEITPIRSNISRFSRGTLYGMNLDTATGTMIAMTGDTLDLHYVIKDC